MDSSDKLPCDVEISGSDQQNIVYEEKPLVRIILLSEACGLCGGGGGGGGGGCFCGVR